MLAAVVIAGMAGCAKPEGSPIYKGNDGVASDEADVQSTAPVAEKYQAPAHFTDSIVKDNLTVTVDADVNVPDTGQFGVSVIAENDIDQQMTDRIRTALIGDAVLYDGSQFLTKAMLQQRIDNFNQILADPAGTTYIPEGTPEFEAYLTNVQGVINYLQGLYDNAPDAEAGAAAAAPVPADTQLHPDQSAWLMYENRNVAYEDLPMVVRGTATLDDGRDVLLSIVGKSSWNSVGVMFQTNWANDIESPSTGLDPMRFDVPAEDAGITKEQACETALSTVRQMGLDNLEVSSAEEQTIIEFNGTGPDSRATATRPCYEVYLTPNIGGVTTNYAVPKDIPSLNGQAYTNSTVPDVTVSLTVAKEGVLAMECWNGPTSVTGTISDNVQLLGFDDIRAIFDKQIIMDNIDSECDTMMAANNLAISSRTITINEARLGLMCVPWQGHEGKFLMTPVWDFYGYESLKMQDPAAAVKKQFTINADGEYVSNTFGKSYLTLNAIDGSVIDR